LQQAASRTDGTILWLAGPRTVDEYIRPALEAARPAELGPARIVASVPVCVTDDADGVRGLIGTFLAGYNELPSYRQIMDREGAGGPQDVAVVGTEAEVQAGIERFAAAGVTDFSALEFVMDPQAAERTRALLRSML
jgi:5,10-methylenetetrahydromethanopterin reductase